jgi:GR25 family glycosyltransferase involved in LPS biosynthesis
MPDIEKIYCINLKHNTDRWTSINSINEKIKKTYDNNLCIERFEAVDSRENQIKCLTAHNLKLNPFNLSMGMYFYYCPGAIGCFLSHFSIWKKIIENKISYTLIIEDDIAPSELLQFLNDKKNISEKLENNEFLFLSKRVFHNKPYIDFWGAESYILSYAGAKKLLHSIKNPSVFNEIDNFEEWGNIVKYFSVKKIELPKQNKNIPENSIIVPNDRLLSLCCHAKCDNSVLLKYSVHPCINLKNALSNKSNINQQFKPWGAKMHEIENYLENIK